jgi:phosphoribosylformylglycinamidine (FGAM) synthase PurS component
MTQRTYAVTLKIPDNAAFTALLALQRLGIKCTDVRRADIFAFDVDDAYVAALDDSITRIETIYNPNKHALEVRGERPSAGEVWIAPHESAAPAPPDGLRIAGRTLPGVRALHRMTAWRLLDDGRELSDGELGAAVERLLCNPAFQKAITH